jgi:large subunit ribosomal protein L25
MEIVKLVAQKRVEQGKGPSRRLRVEGKIPAVAYGKKLAATPLAVDPKALRVAITGAHGLNNVIELDVEGNEKITAMVREYSHHPVSRAYLHVDFLQVDLNEPVDVSVPFKLVGKAKGIVLGGVLQQIFRALPVRCLPEKIPTVIEADISDLGLNDSFKVNQLKLGDGVSVRLGAEQTVASVVAPEKNVEEEKAAAATPAAAGKDAKAAAPAAKAAAAPAKKK